MAKISIIIPVFNAEKRLQRCIDSVLSQTVSDWECILVDDGSSDKSPVICDEYARFDDRIRVIHKENGGVSSARNRGIESAGSEWITFIDSDDYVSPIYLENLSPDDILDEGVLYSSGILFEHPDKHLSNKFKNESTSVVTTDFPHFKEYDILANGYPFAKLFNKKILISNNLRFNKNVSFFEDYLFVIHYLCHIRSVRLIEECDYHYWIDSSVPTLSNKRHDFSEHLLTAQLMNDAAVELCSAFHCDLSDIASKKRMRVFGPLQLKFAADESLFYPDPFTVLTQCAEMADKLRIDFRDLPAGGKVKLTLFLLKKRLLHTLLFYLKMGKITKSLRTVF